MNRLNPPQSILDSYDDDEFRRRYRFSKSTVLELYDEIKDEIQIPCGSRHIPAFHALLITLRYPASGSWQIVSADLISISQPIMSRIVARITPAIANLYKYVRFPITATQVRSTKERFFDIAQFPGILGAIDCTHIHLTAPGIEDGERSRNRKGRLSINVQAIVDGDMKFTNVVARWPGSTHESRIFDNSLVHHWFSQTRRIGWLLGDNGYPCRRYLMTPLLNPDSASQRNYNRRHIKTRNIVERTFGAWKRTFFVLSTTMGIKTKTVLVVIIACAVLWNIRRS